MGWVSRLLVAAVAVLAALSSCEASGTALHTIHFGHDTSIRDILSRFGQLGEFGVVFDPSVRGTMGLKVAKVEALEAFYVACHLSQLGIKRRLSSTDARPVYVVTPLPPGQRQCINSSYNVSLPTNPGCVGAVIDVASRLWPGRCSTVAAKNGSALVVQGDLETVERVRKLNGVACWLPASLMRSVSEMVGGR